MLITEKFLFLTFRWWKIRSFISQKFEWKMIFTWSLWIFHYIRGLGKYGFLCSAVSSVSTWLSTTTASRSFSSNVSALSFDLLLKLNLLLGLVAFVLETLLLSIYIILPNRSYLIFLVTFQLNSKITLFVNLSYRLNPSLLMGISHSRLCVNMLM